MTTTAFPQDERNAGRAFGMGVAACIMTFFGFIWLGWGFTAWVLLPPAGWAALYLTGIVLLIAAVLALRRGRRLLTRLGGANDFWQQRRARFRIVWILEVLGCFAVVALANFFHRPDLIASGIAIVVGLHFLPMARLFQFPGYYAVGVAMTLAGLVSAAMLQGMFAIMVAALCCGCILWVTALVALFLSIRHAGKVPATD